MFIFTPEKGIAESRQTGFIRRLNHCLLPFVAAEELRISGSSEALHLAEVVDAVAERRLFGGARLHSSIENCHGAVIIHGASSETSVGVVPTGSRSKRNA